MNTRLPAVLLAFMLPARAQAPTGQQAPATRRADWAATHGSWIAAHDASLQAMLRAQRPDGMFAADPERPAGTDADVAATALAITALLDNGSTMRVGPHRQQIRLAVKWVCSQQHEDGNICDRTAPGGDLVQALAAVAITRSYRESNVPSLRNQSFAALHALVAPEKGAPGDPLALANAVRSLAFATANLDPGADGPMVELRQAVIAALDARVGPRGQVVWQGPLPPFAGAGPDPAETTLAALLSIRARQELPEGLARRLALAVPGLEQAPKRWAKATAIDGLTLALGAEAAFAVGGATWEAWRAAIEEHVLPLVAVEGEKAGDARFACGYEVLMQPTSSKALAVMTLAVPIK